MPSQKRKFGDIGERVAEDYLKDKGYRIIERNYWKPWGEIDIIGKKDNLLVFFEVKTSDLVHFNSFLPEQRVNHKKIKRLCKVCETYLMTKNYPIGQEWQIDILSIGLGLSVNDTQINHFENAVWEERY